MIKDHLVTLILGLSKSEKKNFRLIARKAGKSQLLYEKLYDHILHYQVYDEAHILKKIPQIKKSQLPNLKSNLYKVILRSLRDLNKENILEIKAREHYDFAKILYSKGQYRASLDMLQKVKELAAQLYREPLQYLAVSFEKHIESQHVTGSMSPKALQLEKESIALIQSISIRDALSNLSLLMYGKYLQLGILRDKEEQEGLKAYFDSKMPAIQLEELDMYQRLYLYQAYVWYYRMIQDFVKCYTYAKRWVDLFEVYPTMKRFDAVTYIKGLHNILNPLYIMGDSTRFEYYLEVLKDFDTDDKYSLSNNEQGQLDLFLHIHTLERIIMTVDYDNGVHELAPIEELIDSGALDLHRQLSFRYMLACVYFGANDRKAALRHLNILTNQKYIDFKEDIQCFARILKLITHVDMGDQELVLYDARSVYRFLTKMKELQEPQKEILKFVRKLMNLTPDNLMEAYAGLREKLLPLEKDPIQRRTFLYLDLISWLDSKMKGVTMAEAIRLRRGLPQEGV